MGVYLEDKERDRDAFSGRPTASHAAHRHRRQIMPVGGSMRQQILSLSLTPSLQWSALATKSKAARPVTKRRSQPSNRRTGGPLRRPMAPIRAGSGLTRTSPSNRRPPIVATRPRIAGESPLGPSSWCSVSVYVPCFTPGIVYVRTRSSGCVYFLLLPPFLNTCLFRHFNK